MGGNFGWILLENNRKKPRKTGLNGVICHILARDMICKKRGQDDAFLKRLSSVIGCGIILKTFIIQCIISMSAKSPYKTQETTYIIAFMNV